MFGMRNEIVALARHQIMEEYLNQRSRELNEWRTKSEAAWKEQRAVLPFPFTSQYPSEQEIYQRAVILNEAVEQARMRILLEKTNTPPPQEPAPAPASNTQQTQVASTVDETQEQEEEVVVVEEEQDEEETSTPILKGNDTVEVKFIETVNKNNKSTISTKK